jgi:dihydropteroate synthase
VQWRWSLRQRELSLGERCLVMGIVNVTPDSFSDGGRHADAAAAVSHGLTLVREGADILDVGGESTRPGATDVDGAEELRRVIPVIERLSAETDVPISIDTRKAIVAERALAAGARIVNDVSGLRGDARMANVISSAHAGLVMMHMQGTPASMQRSPHYDDLFGDLRAYFADGLAIARAHGIDDDRIVLDPGIGFGKTLAHNLALVANPDALAGIGIDRPLLFGVSRKSLLGSLTGRPVEEREDATTACVAVLAFLGAAIVRVHDVRRASDAVRVGDALRAARGATSGCAERARTRSLAGSSLLGGRADA